MLHPRQLPPLQALLPVETPCPRYEVDLSTETLQQRQR
jgi:hypothetical protein